MSNVKSTDPVPDGVTEYCTTRQMKPNDKGYVGYETEWVEWQKEVPYSTPKRP